MLRKKRRKPSLLKKVLRKVALSPGAYRIVAFTKHASLPGFNHIPIYDVINFFLTGIQRGSIITRAQSLAFSFILALFPAIIFLFSLIPYIPINNFQDNLLAIIHDFLPQNAYEATRETIVDIIKHQRGGLLSIGFLAALYLTSNGMMALMRSFNSSYHAQEKRTPVRQRTVAAILTIILSTLLIIATTLLIFSQVAVSFLTEKHILKTKTHLALISIGKWAVVLSLFYSAISFLYYYAPSVKSKWRHISAGSTFATILTLIVSIAFAFFVNNFGSYNKLYGSIGTLIVVMLWIYFNSMILLLGFELNASIDRVNKELHGKHPV